MAVFDATNLICLLDPSARIAPDPQTGNRLTDAEARIDWRWILLRKEASTSVVWSLASCASPETNAFALPISGAVVSGRTRLAKRGRGTLERSMTYHRCQSSEHGGTTDSLGPITTISPPA